MTIEKFIEMFRRKEKVRFNSILYCIYSVSTDTIYLNEVWSDICCTKISWDVVSDVTDPKDDGSAFYDLPKGHFPFFDYDSDEIDNWIEKYEPDLKRIPKK